MCYNENMNYHPILDYLNPNQREAVTQSEGPILIIAGAGSGKTKTLVHRVAYLVAEKSIHSRNILAVTFTNKAAQEMKERIARLLRTVSPCVDYELPIIGTFHAVCARILRMEIDKLGYKKSFGIFDEQDSAALLKKVTKKLEIDPKQFNFGVFAYAISKAKNELIGSEAFVRQADGYFEETVARVYGEYQRSLKENNSLDFDDLVMLTVDLFQKFHEILSKYQNIFRYILVDDYQDTNQSQYVLVNLLAKKHRNLCVVGDDWQSIYGWRQADIRNILNFEKDYPEAKVVKLEQNYRSTQIILDAAYGVISKNINRKDKNLWTQRQGGHLIVSCEAKDEAEEAEFVAKEIYKITSGNNPAIFRRDRDKRRHSFSDCVVLYRTNAQSRVLEEFFLRRSLPYRIIGGVKFYQRKEVKDIVAYLRLINNFDDAVALARIINEPCRGIGETTMNKWISLAKENGKDLINNWLDISANPKFPSEPDKTARIQNSKIDSILKFCDFIKRMKETQEHLLLADFISKVFRESGYEKKILDGTPEGETRWENIQELLSVTKKYADKNSAEALAAFLEEAALSADTDKINQKKDVVHLMTLHSAKGLEFPFVFIVGLEEGILPHSRSMLSEQEMEEERRLMYVGITRAKERVYLLFTRERTIFGSTQINPPSRFLEDIPSCLIKTHEPEIADQKVKIHEKEKNNSKSAAIVFKDGDQVKHLQFGKGLVVSVQGDEVTIAFKKFGIKKFSISFAPLEKV